MIAHQVTEYDRPLTDLNALFSTQQITGLIELSVECSTGYGTATNVNENRTGVVPKPNPGRHSRQRGWLAVSRFIQTLLFGLMKWLFYLPTRYAGGVAYLVTAFGVAFAVGFIIGAPEQLVLGTQRVTNAVTFVVFCGLMGYLLLYDHSPTSDRGLRFRPQGGVANNAKEGFVGTQEALDGLGTVSEAYRALFASIYRSIEARRLVVDERVRENIGFLPETTVEEVDSPPES